MTDVLKWYDIDAATSGSPQPAGGVRDNGGNGATNTSTSGGANPSLASAGASSGGTATVGAILTSSSTSSDGAHLVVPLLVHQGVVVAPILFPLVVCQSHLVLNMFRHLAALGGARIFGSFLEMILGILTTISDYS